MILMEGHAGLLERLAELLVPNEKFYARKARWERQWLKIKRDHGRKDLLTFLLNIKIITQGS